MLESSFNKVAGLKRPAFLSKSDSNTGVVFLEAVSRMCYVKLVFLKISQNSQENKNLCQSLF